MLIVSSRLNRNKKLIEFIFFLCVCCFAIIACFRPFLFHFVNQTKMLIFFIYLFSFVDWIDNSPHYSCAGFFILHFIATQHQLWSGPFIYVKKVGSLSNLSWDDERNRKEGKMQTKPDLIKLLLTTEIQQWITIRYCLHSAISWKKVER